MTRKPQTEACPNEWTPDDVRCIVIGASMGAVQLFSYVFKQLVVPLRVPVAIVQHMHSSADGYILEHLNTILNTKSVKEAKEKEPLKPSEIYFAPTNYHLLIEKDHTFSLSVDEKVNYARPSIDVLFESAAKVYTDSLVSILLTGANHDGAFGTEVVKQRGGLTIAQNPSDATCPIMPQRAIDTGAVDRVMTKDQIIDFLNSFSLGEKS